MKTIENGLFIAIEGGEGSGKTSIANELVKYFSNNKYMSMYTREPGGIPLAEKIREVVLNNDDIDPMVQLLLFMASRKLNIDNIIKPALNDEYIVICDRFALSTMVYQGIVEKIPMQQISYIMNLISKDLKPDIEIVLDVNADVGLQRVMTGNREVNSIDKNGLDFHNKINEAYRVTTYMAPYRFIIDANRDMDTVLNECIDNIEFIINNKFKHRIHEKRLCDDTKFDI